MVFLEATNKESIYESLITSWTNQDRNQRYTKKVDVKLSVQYARGHAMDAKREKTRKFLAGAKKMQQKTNARKPTPDVKQGWASRAEKHATQA